MKSVRTRLTLMLAGCAVIAGPGCGGDRAESTAALPETGIAYRALGEEQRLAVAARCRDDAAAAARGPAASQLADVDARALRGQLDAAFRVRHEQPSGLTEVCAEQIPFVTPGLRIRFEEAEGRGDTFAYETDSDVPLRIRGAVAGAPPQGTVVARRESGGSRAFRGRIGPDGRFSLPAIRLRKIADNTFIVAVHAPPNAPRKVYFSAICLDCLAGGPS